MGWKVGDWVVFDLKVGQIKEINENGWQEFSDGVFTTSGGMLQDRFRPLTLRNKVIAETFEYYRRSLDNIDGSSGFNFPDIHNYLCDLSLNAIDGDDDAVRAAYDKGRDFLRAASEYKKVIDGVLLFRPKHK